MLICLSMGHIVIWTSKFYMHQTKTTRLEDCESQASSKEGSLPLLPMWSWSCSTSRNCRHCLTPGSKAWTVHGWRGEKHPTFLLLADRERQKLVLLNEFASNTYRLYSATIKGTVFYNVVTSHVGNKVCYIWNISLDQTFSVGKEIIIIQIKALTHQPETRASCLCKTS